MKLLLINYEYPPLGGGAATATWQMGKALIELGHEVTILTSGYKNNFGFSFEEGMRIFRCPTVRKRVSQSNLAEMLLFVMSAFIFLPWIGRRLKPKGAIVFFAFPCGPLGLWSRTLFRIPYVISLRGGDVPGTEKKLSLVHKLLTPVRRLIYKQSRSVIANSEGLTQLALKADPNVDILTVPNGVDTRFFKPGPHRHRGGPVSLIFVGRFSEQKNLFFLFERLAQLKKQIPYPFILNLVGDGPLKNRLQDFSGQLGIHESIKWHGWLKKEQIRTLLQNSDCFINPSLYEGMPNAILEAMACGLPVIASDVPGNRSLIREHENGTLFNLDDPEGFNVKLADMIKKISQGSSPWDPICINRIARQFSWKSTAAIYADLFTIDYGKNRTQKQERSQYGIQA